MSSSIERGSFSGRFKGSFFLRLELSRGSTIGTKFDQTVVDLKLAVK